MLVELSMVEQRCQAVREVLDTGASVTDVAVRYAASTAGLFIAGSSAKPPGLGGPRRPELQTRSLSPSDVTRDRGPHRRAPKSASRMGPRTIRNKLRRELADPPSRSAIYRFSCGIGSSTQRTGDDAARTTSAGSDRGRWSCGNSP
jgi:hypothetical protein